MQVVLGNSLPGKMYMSKQGHSQYTNGQSQLLSHIRLSDEDYLLSQLFQLLLCLS